MKCSPFELGGFFLLATLFSVGVTSAQYSVGSSGPAGGIIIFEDVNDEFDSWDYLEVWPHTLGVFQTLACDYPPLLSSVDFGFGLENSENFKVLDESVNSFDFIGYFDGGDHQDWFIPSKGELEFLISSEYFSIINSGDDLNIVSSSVSSGCNWWRYSSGYGWNTPDLWEWVDVLPMRRFSTDDNNSFCGEGTIWDEEAQLCVLDEAQLLWQPDSNGDSVIGITDLLALLSIWGEQDVDNDGIYDSVDDCVGSYDECGVCNGGGPSVQILQGVTILYDSVYAEQVDQWFVFEVGLDSTFVYECGVYGCTDETAINFNASANIDDGSCILELLGCTIPSAPNYNPDANENDGSCEYFVGQDLGFGMVLSVNVNNDEILVLNSMNGQEMPSELFGVLEYVSGFNDGQDLQWRCPTISELNEMCSDLNWINLRLTELNMELLEAEQAYGYINSCCSPIHFCTTNGVPQVGRWSFSTSNDCGTVNGGCSGMVNIRLVSTFVGSEL